MEKKIKIIGLGLRHAKMVNAINGKNVEEKNRKERQSN